MKAPPPRPAQRLPEPRYRMLKYLLPVGLFAVLVGFLYFGLGRDKETLPSPLIGKAAPVFELTRLDDPGKTFSNSEFAGKPYVLNVWGSWCVGCRQEHGALLEIARRGEVPIVGLNYNDERQAALNWLEQLGNPYVVSAFDGEGRVGIDWGVYGAPETFLVDANGKVIKKHVAPITVEIWEQEFVPLLAQAKAGSP
ncbi:cytochrome C-type biogenesis protein [Steroidobacter agaridevorans]|uniref:Cytochrome C-type biogenesis protein n=2 Tax=Steroidobacter agaridevorans TaxID=2695856 RepID=A0A829YJ44_9GAMM|nr:cytochrome C-type biogenesis protein [Steroidobacter agaridevorans]GFE86718.1 cytochrome C-type biogenesis protein [Steroidobacter agaridevorans]